MVNRQAYKSCCIEAIFSGDWHMLVLTARRYRLWFIDIPVDIVIVLWFVICVVHVYWYLFASLFFWPLPFYVLRTYTGKGLIYFFIYKIFASTWWLSHYRNKGLPKEKQRIKQDKSNTQDNIETALIITFTAIALK